MEIANAYEKLCVDGKLEDEFVIVEKKTLTKALAFLTMFKTKWIRILLSRVHDGAFWLETGPVKFMKKTINMVTRFQTLDWPKTLRRDKTEVIEKNDRAKWNNGGMTIDTIQDPVLDFAVRVISHKFYQSSRLNNIPCIVVDVAYKLVKKDHIMILSS